MRTHNEAGMGDRPSLRVIDGGSEDGVAEAMAGLRDALADAKTAIDAAAGRGEGWKMLAVAVESSPEVPLPTSLALPLTAQALRRAIDATDLLLAGPLRLAPLSDTQHEALAFLLAHGGEGAIDNAGHLVAAGVRSDFLAATWLRLVARGLVAGAGPNRLEITAAGIAALRPAA